MICLVMVQVLGKGILSSEEGAAYVGEVVSYSVRKLVNTLGEKFRWGIWRLEETMLDKPKV